MNPIQVLGLFVLCSAVYALFVAVLASLDVSVFGALAVLYVAMFWMMLGMQRRARETFEPKREPRQPRQPRGLGLDTPVSH